MVFEAEFLTPPKLAKRLGISQEKVIGFILAGELQGVDLASQGSTRPRYRVSEEAVAAFLLRRSAAVAPALKRPRRTSARREFYA